ncbi:FkbM family methyltransferase [Tunicatimonas pelagia]|uniref:FkbM family methyltransferase n=1 Tax=Tunicatimonas pelagia TaxID=931531 RepID=UPI0026665DF0|nr:FkbM family methyltransferase [Tunicatimonas pelagia]WKN44453.1 FkbM family methyltransferase [Tunicatimonas pelagia]
MSLTILDIGARHGIKTIFPNFLDPSRYYGLSYLNKKNLSFIGVEPDEDGAIDLRAGGDYDKVISKALYSRKGKQTLYITRQPACSSLLKPDQQAIKENIDIEWWKDLEVINEIKVDTTTLGELCDQYSINPDFIKIDTQGVEYEVVEGGMEYIKNTVAVLAELCEKPWYEGQKDAASFIFLMKNLGFEVVAKNFKPHVPTERDYLFVKEYQKIENEKDLGKAIFIYYLFGKEKEAMTVINKYCKKESLSLRQSWALKARYTVNVLRWNFLYVFLYKSINKFKAKSKWLSI